MLQKICLVFLASVSLAAAQSSASSSKSLPPGPMQAKIKAACTQCHDATRITEQHLSRDEWSAQLEKMEGLGAVIPDEDRAAILSYLVAHFGPQKAAAKEGSAKEGSVKEGSVKEGSAKEGAAKEGPAKSAPAKGSDEKPPEGKVADKPAPDKPQ